MQREMNGLRYDTDTAEKICEWSTGQGMDREHTALYRTAKGAWFIAGEGGPMTQWRKYHGTHWAAGEGLRPIGRGEARQLLERHGTSNGTAPKNWLRGTFTVEDA
jgi:hypothetical protein